LRPPYACEQVLNGVEQQRLRKEEKNSFCFYVRRSYANLGLDEDYINALQAYERARLGGD
jgi:hypothetical protein